MVLDNIAYTSVELAYQAAKWKPEDREYFQNCTELESIDYNRTHTPNRYTEEEWNNKKVEVMRDLLKQKFDANINPENFEKLTSTKDKHLEEMNWWGDVFWGTDEKGGGQNMLGKMLMEVRDK